jgi:carbohydrate diacid regulator
MRLSEELAGRIVERLRSVLKREVLLTDDEGVVRAATDPVQVGILHPIAHGIANRPGTVVIDKEEASKYHNMQPSVLHPLWHEGELLGVFVFPGNKREFPSGTLKLIQGLAEIVMFQYELAEALETKEETQARFIQKLLLDDAIKTFDEVYPEADVLRLNLRRRYAVCYIKIHSLKEIFIDQTRGKRRRITFSQFVSEISRLISGSLGERSSAILYQDPGVFVVLYDLADQRIPKRPTLFYKKFVRQIYDSLKETVPGTITIGIGGHYPALEGLRKSYREAKLACDVGAKIRGRDNVYHIYDVGMYVAMTNISAEDKLELAKQILEPLLENPELLRTVKTFLDEGMNLTEAAAKLHIHRNTLIYRLDKIEEMISLDPRRFDDALQIKLGLMIYQASQLV